MHSSSKSGIHSGLPAFARRRSLFSRLGLSFFVVFAVVCFCDASNAASLTAQETISHQRDGNHVVFNLEERPVAVSLHGLVASEGRWVNLVTQKNPRATLSRIKVPARWRQAELRVVATFRSKDSSRKEVDHQHDPDSRSVTFLTTTGARLFSVEAKEKRQLSWKRISTVGAPERPTSVRVALPVSLPKEAQIRVVAVSGHRKTFPLLPTPLSSRLRGGVATFGAMLAAVSDQPLLSIPTVAASVADAGAKSAVPSIEESDVWRIHGDKIYFFNRLRGLQILNAADRAKPFVSGQLPMAGVGEEMYLLGPSAEAASGAILLTTLPWSPNQSAGTKINRISFSGDTPSLEASLDLPSDYVESRLIGGLLHVVTRSGSWSADSQAWVSETLVSTIDLSQGNALVNTETRTLPYQAAVVGSTGKYLWVSGTSPSGGWRHRLAAFPIRLDGSLGDALESELGGHIQDKFKVGDTSQGLAAVVQDWSWPDWRQKTSVETYREQGGALALDASLEVVRDEALFASRFDGDRLYAVTFQQVDPLWIIDLSDPAKPEIKGHLEVPGWSSFIEPLGDVLLAVGRDGGRVQVSMFDVSDPARPALAQRVDIGEGWSWSEAEWDEKAVKILPEAGLILVPVVESLGNVRSNRVSMVEFDIAARTLVKRGTIAHAFVPRRAALMGGDTIASLSNRELLLVNAANRDFPAVTGNLALAYSVDHIVLHNGTAFLFENGESGWLGSDRQATLRTAASANPENISAEIALPCEDVAAATVIGDRLIVVERPADRFFWLNSGAAGAETAATPHVSVWSLDDPKQPALIGRMTLPYAAAGEVELLPVDGGRVAVVTRERGFNCYVRPLPSVIPLQLVSDADSPLPVTATMARMAPPFLGWGGQSLRVAIAQVDGSLPGLVGTWDLSGDFYTDISEIFSAGDLLLFSFAKREEATIDPNSSGGATMIMDNATGLWTTTLPSVRPRDGFWSDWTTRHWLQILDLADATAPMPWAPVQLPGELLGVSWLQRAGGLLFARSDDRVAALGFDGENASIVAELPARSPLCLQGSSVYFSTETGVAEWTFSEQTRRWRRQAGWKFDLAGGVYHLHVVDGALLAGGYNKAWVLGEDGSIASTALPWGANLGTAAGDKDTVLVPAGEYGAVRLR